MADDQVVTNIVARADFSDLIANVRKVTTSLAAMQQQIGSSNKVLSAQINAVNRSFGETLRSTGQFSTHFVSLANDVDIFGKRLEGGKLKLRDYFSTLQTHTRTSGGLIRDLARQQVQLQNAILQPLGRNAQGLMQFNVHVPQGLDEIKNKGAIARQEMQILNKVMQEGSVGLINWGKNTQWAGRQLTVGLTVPIVAFGAAAAKAFREADQELTRLTKVYGGLAATSSSELQKVRRDVTAVADELARGYGSSFKETLALSADIAATGKQGSELLGSIRETTRLAVLGEVDRQDAMKATLAIQSAFRQDTDELAKSINFLNAVENQTSTSLSDLVEAIPKAGPIIKGLGGNIQDLALYLTAMKEGGINASEGANAIKSALASLINPTDVAVKKFEGFGIDLMGIVNNNAGDVTKTLFALQGALNKLDPLQKSQAIEQLFGKFQFARLSALFENLGAQGSQTLKVMDLMKASSKDLASIAGRELSMVTESASGKYRRAVEGLKADLAGVGEEFLKVSTFFINLVDGIIQFVNKLPAPVKTILTFLAGLTAVTGPLIMLTGVLANFLGYVIKGAFHLKALFKGGEGWRMLTPEILAAQKAGSLIEKTFYSDAKAALALAEALQVLSAGMTSIQSKMTQGVVSVQPMLSTVAGNIIRPPGDDGGGGGGVGRVVDPKNPLVGPAGTRASAHMVPRSGMTPEQRAAQTIHSFLPAPIPVNQAVGANPQIFAAGDLPAVPGLTTIPGRSGAVSTGVVASEAAKWHTMVGTLSMMTKTEVSQMKTQIRTTGTVTSEFTQAFGSLLPQMTSIAENAAQQSAIIVAEAKAGTISVQTARQRIIALNIQVEQLMAQATIGTATSLGRTAVITGVPTLDQPVVDPRTGKSNMRELFKKGKTRSFVDELARLMGVRTWGAGYSTHTTIPIRRNSGGLAYLSGGSSSPIVPGPSVDKDVVPALLTPGEFVVNRRATQANLPLLQAINGRGSRGPRYNDGADRDIAAGVNLTNEEMRILNPGFKGSLPAYRAKGGSGTYNGVITDPAIIAKYPKLVDPKTGFIGIEQINAALAAPGSRGLPGEVMLASIDAAAKAGGTRSSTEQLLQSLARSGVISAAEAASISDEIHSKYSQVVRGRIEGISDRRNPFWAVSNRIILSRLAGNADALSVWSDFSKAITHHTGAGRRSTTALSLKFKTPSGVVVDMGRLRGSRKLGTAFLHSSVPRPLIERMTSKNLFIKEVMERALSSRFMRRNSGGMIPGYNMGGMIGSPSEIVARGYNDSFFPVGPTTGTPITASQFEQATGYRTLADQMRATGQLPSGQLPSGSVSVPEATQKSGGKGLLMGAARMGGSIGGWQLGSMLGSSLTGGNQFGSILGGFAGGAAADAAIIKLTNHLSEAGKAAGGAATKTSLLSKAFQFFIKLPGPVKLLAVVVGVGLAIKTMNDKIEEHRRIVSSGFGISEESAKKLGLQYKKLGSEIDSYQQKYDLMLAKAAANRYSQTKAEGKGIDITVPELEKLKKEVAKNFPDEIKMFDKVTNKEAIERAANLKAGMVAAGKSVEEANEIILAMIMNSNKSAYALDILGDRGFGKIQGKVSATNATVKTFSNVIKEGNFDQLPIALQTAVNALDNLQQSFIKVDDKTKKALTSSEAYEKVLGQISTTANQAIGEKGLEEILAQNEGLRDVISSTDTLAGIWAKIKLSVSGITFNLKDMSTETATAISLLLEQQKNYLSSNDSLISSAADLIAKTGNITANQLIKNANRTKESIQKEIELRQKNIQRIKDEADAKKKALEQETEAEDFLLQIQKKQIEYSEALASGDMATAAQAQLDIQSMTGARQLDLAKTAIDSKADKDIKKQQDLINNLTDALDGLSKSLEKQIAAAGSQQAKKADMQGLYDLFFQAVTLGMGGVTADEKLIIADIAKQLSNSGIEEFVNLSNKYLQMSPTGPYVGRAQAMGFGSLESLGASSFSVVAGKLQVEDTELSKYIKALAAGQTADSTTSFTPKLTTEKSAMGPKATYTITPQQYVDSGMYVQGENPVKEKKTFIDYAGRRFKVVGVQEDGDYIVERVFAAGGMIKNFMPGGNVTGPGTSTSDSIPAMLSDGEYVIRASSVKKYGTETFEKLNAGKFANGGPVNTSALITPSIPYYMKNGGMIPGYFDGGSVFNRILNSAISPFGAAGFGLDVLSKIDSYRKNKDIGKFVKVSGDGAEWMQKATVNPERESIYVYDVADRYDAKDRRPIVDGALKYLTGQTGVQFKRATFGMRNNPEVVKLNWNELYKEEDSQVAGTAVTGSRYVDLRSPFYLNLGSIGRSNGIQTISHEILHSLGIGDYQQNYEPPFDNSMFFGHAKNPFNVMFPFGIPGLTPPKFVSKGDTEQLRYITDFYNFESKDIPIRKAMGGLIPGYHKGGPAGHKHSSRQQLPFFPWRSDLPNYWSNGKPTGNPRTGRWGELRYNPSPGHDIWGGTEIPGLKFTGKTPQQSDYWHQMQEQPKKSTGLGMGVDKDPMLLAGSGASTGGIGMGAYGLGPLMLAGGGSVIKTALGWITKNLSKFKLPSFRVAKNTGRTVEPENIETFLSSVLGDVKLPAIKTAALPPNHAGQYIPRFGDEAGTNLLPYILLQSKIKTSGSTAVHETMHHFDVDVLHDSFKKTLARLRESGKTDLADEYESIFVTGENKQKGFGYESWAQKALDLRDHDSIAYFGGTAEAFAEESTFKAYQKFITSKSPKDKKLALTIGNPYGPGFSTDILRGYFKSYKEYQRNALASPIRLNPFFLKGLVENSPNMPEKTKNIYSMWAEGLTKFRPPARKNQDEILNSLQFQQFKQYIIDNNLDRAKGYSQGGYINPSSLISSSVPHYMNMGGKIPGYHDGGPIGHKHPSTSYSPTPMSTSAKEIMALRTKLIKSGYANSQYLPRLVEPTSGVSPFNIPSSVGSTSSLFSPATGIAGDPKFIADSQEATSFSRQLGDMFNFAMTPLTPSKAPDVNKQTEKSKYMREQMAIAWDMMHKVNPAFKLGSWLVKPMFDAATNIGAGNGKWNDYTTIASSFIGSGLYKNAAKGAFGGIKALSSKAPAFLKNFGSSAAGKLVPVPKTTVHAQMPGPKKLSEDTLKSIKEMEDQLAKTIQEIDDLRSGAYFEKHTWANPAYKDSSIEHLEAAVARYTENIARAKATDVPPGFFGALDLFIQKPMYAQGNDFSAIASATSRSSAFTTMPFYRALSMKDMAEITGWSTRPNIADMTLGLPWMKQHGSSSLVETPWGNLYGSRWRPGVLEEIPPGATRHPDVPAHVPDSALYGGLPGRLSPESWQFLEKDPALKIGESWIPQMHKSITDSLDFAKHVAINSGTGGGGTSAIARFEFTPESKGILDLRGIAQGAGWNLDPNAGEGLIAPWTEYVLKAINKNKYNYSVPGFDGSPSTLTKLIDEYVFEVLGQHTPPGWTPFYKASGGLVSQHNIPKFEKGINMVPANMLAMLHKNEAVVPANMNPFNPNAQSYSPPSVSYNISPVINAAPGMDEQAIANMATRQVLAEIKVIDARNNASMGRPGMRVVGK